VLVVRCISILVWGEAERSIARNCGLEPLRLRAPRVEPDAVKLEFRVSARPRLRALPGFGRHRQGL